MPVRPQDAIDATLELARDHGVLAGPTSGAAWWAARQYLAAQPSPQAVPRRAVLIGCDRLEPYPSHIRQRRPALFGAGRNAGTASSAAAEPAAPEISAARLAALDPSALVLCVDTRGSMAYRIGHVPGSVNIRDDQLAEMLVQGIPFPASRTIVLICPAGEQSRRLAAVLCGLGVDAVSLTGGIVAWRDAGLPLESGVRGGAGRAGLPG